MFRPDPFSTFVYEGGLQSAPRESIAFHEVAKEAIVQTVGGLSREPGRRPGKLLLLRSARAGFGKSHLLARVFRECEGDACVLALSFECESRVGWTSLGAAVTSQLAAPAPDGAPTALAIVARQTFAELVGELITRGTVPAEHPGRAIRGLQLDYRAMFDLQDKKAPIAEWFTTNIAGLMPPMAEAMERWRIGDLRTCERLLDLLFHYESEGLLAPADEGSADDESAAKRDLLGLARLVSRRQPLVLVFDDLDALYNDHQSGLDIARLLTALAHDGALPLSITAVNDDLWDASFAGAIPSAFADRLTGGEIRLGGIDIDAARALLASRMDAADITTDGGAVACCPLDLEQLYSTRPEGFSPRELLRKASAAWQHAPAPVASVASVASVVPAAPVEQSPTPARETLGRIREMLRDVNQRRAASGNGGAPTPTPSAKPHTPAPWSPVADSAPCALRDFAREREQFFLGADLVFDPEAIRHALELAGRRSPLIDYHEFDVTAGNGAVRWRSPDHEILFGFEPAEHTPYWRALVQLASESVLGQAKVVAFTPPGACEFATDGLNGHAKKRLDVLELDRSALASLAAAKSVIRGADCEEKTFTQIAPELNFLWRRITRPMGA